MHDNILLDLFLKLATSLAVSWRANYNGGKCMSPLLVAQVPYYTK